MTGTTQSILNWARVFIPDPKTQNKTVTEQYLGYVSTPTGARESFYIKHSPTGSVYLYIDPYEYSPVATFTGQTNNSKVFLWAPSTLSCTLADGADDTPYRPDVYKKVYAHYSYSERKPYTYSDSELADYLPQAVSYLNNTFDQSFTSTGATTNVTVDVSGDDDKELVSKALAIIVRRHYVDEQKKRGFGIRFKGPSTQTLDTIAAMKDYQSVTNKLEQSIQNKIDNDAMSANTTGNVIDIYSEEVVDS